MPVLTLTLIFLLNQKPTWACGSHGKNVSLEKWDKVLMALPPLQARPMKMSLMIQRADVIPELPSYSSPQPWGGVNSNNWRPEAIMANGMSEALNTAWKTPGAVDVLVAIPAK